MSVYYGKLNLDQPKTLRKMLLKLLADLGIKSAHKALYYGRPQPLKPSSIGRSRCH